MARNWGAEACRTVRGGGNLSCGEQTFLVRDKKAEQGGRGRSILGPSSTSPAGKRKTRLTNLAVKKVLVGEQQTGNVYKDERKKGLTRLKGHESRRRVGKKQREKTNW